jgi:2'-5' RNA ligase
MEIRSFLAFELPVDIKKTVAQVSGEILHSGLDARWVKAENIHLTVVFLGNVKTEEIEGIGEEVRNVCPGFGSFDILLKGVGCFPNRRRPRVLWLGLDGDIERMSHFRNDLQKALKAFGIKEEKRPFKPHLTLGRFRSTRKMGSKLEEILSKYAALETPVESLNELYLFKSDLKPGGAVYTKLKSWSLSGEK